MSCVILNCKKFQKSLKTAKKCPSTTFLHLRGIDTNLNFFYLIDIIPSPRAILNSWYLFPKLYSRHNLRCQMLGEWYNLISCRVIIQWLSTTRCTSIALLSNVFIWSWINQILQICCPHNSPHQQRVWPPQLMQQNCFKPHRILWRSIRLILHSEWCIWRSPIKTIGENELDLHYQAFSLLRIGKLTLSRAAARYAVLSSPRNISLSPAAARAHAIPTASATAATAPPWSVLYWFCTHRAGPR